jgi:3-phosphoshikimate 1-carboxyvinyltransferase
MNIKIKPAKKGILGEITVPGDKSISHRAVMIGALADGKTEIANFLNGEDCINTVKAFQQMGVEVNFESETSLSLIGRGLNGLKEPSGVIDLGNSGTSMRLMTGILSGQAFYSVLTGDESLKNRPMDRVVVPLRQMGARIYGRGNGKFAPLTVIGGNLKPIEYKTPIASAQVKSAILLAGLFAEGETKVVEPSRSRDHTERMLKAFGAELKTEGLVTTVCGFPKLKGQKVQVPNDISSAAFFLVAAAICPGSELVIKDIGINPTRSGILEALMMMNAQIAIEDRREVSGEPIADILVRYSHLKGANFEGEQIVRMIDDIPILAVAATQAEGITTIKDASELRVKETDRISAMATELRKMGVEVEELSDGFIIFGGQKLKAASLNSYTDHRVAMSLAIAALIAEGESIIEDVEWVETSFPGFWKLLGECVR